MEAFIQAKMPTPGTFRVESQYEVLVGNIGTVYSGTDEDEAQRTYNRYCTLSMTQNGRAAGESVTLFKDGEIEMELEGE